MQAKKQVGIGITGWRRIVQPEPEEIQHTDDYAEKG